MPTTQPTFLRRTARVNESTVFDCTWRRLTRRHRSSSGTLDSGCRQRCGTKVTWRIERMWPRARTRARTTGVAAVDVSAAASFLYLMPCLWRQWLRNPMMPRNCRQQRPEVSQRRGTPILVATCIAHPPAYVFTVAGRTNELHERAIFASPVLRRQAAASLGL